MTMPDVVVLGAHWKRGKLRAVADLEYANWSVNRRTTVEFANASTPEAVQQNDWHDTVTVRAGGEWFRGALVVRGGAYFDPSPVRPIACHRRRPMRTASGSPRARATGSDLRGARCVRRAHVAPAPRDHEHRDDGGELRRTALVLGAGVRWTPRP